MERITRDPTISSYNTRNTITKALVVLLLFSSLLGYAKIPYLYFSIFNLSHPLFALGLLLLYLSRAEEILRRHQSTLLVLVLLYVWTWVSAFFSELPGTALRYSLKYSLHITAFLALLTVTARTQDNDPFYRLIYRFLTVLAAFGVIEYLAPHLWVFKLLRSPDSLAVYPRISSLMQGPNQYSTLLSIGILVGIISYHNLWVSRLEFGLSTLFLLAASFLAGSWNGWLMLGIGIFLTLLYRIITIRSITCIVGVLVFAGIMSHLLANQFSRTQMRLIPDATTQAFENVIHERLGIRLLMWNAAITAMKTRPLTGVGIQVFGKQIGKQVVGSEHYHAHNLFLNVGAEIGLPGLLLFLLFLYAVFRHADFTRPIIAIPMIMLAASQVLDYYMHDLTFATLALYFVATAVNSRNDHT